MKFFGYCYRKVLVCGAALVAMSTSAVAGTQWQPEAAKYGYSLTKDVGIPMDDGVLLSADVYYPVDSLTGKRAAGKFPVLLEQTPYGRNVAAFSATADYFVGRGYIIVVADQRGFGKSRGQAAWFGSRIGKDGANLVDWAARLDGANGSVGLMGCSYLGVVQFFTADSVSRNSPLKAIAPFCVDSNFYRDLTAFGGIPTQFTSVVRGLTAPGVEDDRATDPYMQMIIGQETGDGAYYDDYWKSLDVTSFMPKITSLGIPILSESGWHDLFPGGNIDAHVAAQNAFMNRPIGYPLSAGTKVSGRYQAIVGPWIHSEHVGDTLQPILLEWFDTWLKGKASRIANTDKPLHLFVLGPNRWIDTATYPLTNQAVTFRLSPGSLRTGKPECSAKESVSSAESQTLMWAPEGEGAILSFETEPLDAPIIIAGPGGVTVSLKSTRPEVELASTLFDVAPDGSTTKITNGVLLGSQRALDRAASWYAMDGQLIRPSHYFTKAMSSPVPVGETIKLDIELLPAMIQIPSGHRLRLQIISEPASNFLQYSRDLLLPNPLLPTPEELANLTGGIYTLMFECNAASTLQLSTANEADIVASPIDWGPAE
jgi:predicted acyl esterase